MQTTGLAVDGDTWTRSKFWSSAIFIASAIPSIPFLSPDESINKTFSAFIREFMGVEFLLLVAIVITLIVVIH